MSKLIDKEEAIEALGARPISWTDSDYELGRQNQYDEDMEAIASVPTMDIVTCKECKFASYEPYEDRVDVYVCNYNHWTRSQGGRNPDWYCKGGKRRTDERSN